MSKQDVIARSLNSRREVVYNCNKHILYIQQVVKAYRTQKDTHVNPIKTTKVCIIVNTSKRKTTYNFSTRSGIHYLSSPVSWFPHDSQTCTQLRGPLTLKRNPVSS